MSKRSTVRCPGCGNREIRVVTSSTIENGKVTRRVRACLTCGERYMTEERYTRRIAPAEKGRRRSRYLGAQLRLPDDLT
jgi:transcriptional repressor NrdR